MIKLDELKCNSGNKGEVPKNVNVSTKIFAFAKENALGQAD